MLAIGVYLKKRYGDDWQAQFSKYNAAMCAPALVPGELATLAKSLERKDYAYRCKQAPIAQHCNRRACLKRHYGVGQTEQTYDICGLTWYRTENTQDTVYVGLEVCGQRFILSVDELWNVDKFNKLMFSRVGTVVTQLNQARWRRFLGELARNADNVTLPAEAGESGYLWVHVQDFLAQKAQAKDLSEILLGKPYRDGERIYFRISDLLDFLRTKRQKPMLPQQMFQFLHEKGGEVTIKRLTKTQTTRLWSLPVLEEPEVVVLQTQGSDEVF
jgi:hypothetical protein